MPVRSRTLLARGERCATAGIRRPPRRLYRAGLWPTIGKLRRRELRVTGSRIDPVGVVVASQIIRSQGPPIEVDWRLSIANGLYKISDISIDSVSMAPSDRNEFAAIIERNGRQVDALLATIRQ